MRPIHLTLLATAASACLLGAAQAQTATEAELARRLDQLAVELAAVKSQLAALQQQRAAAPVPAAAPMAAVPVPAEAVPARAQTSTASSTVLSGYAELNYNRPTRATQNTQADLRRFVLGIQHRLDERTQIVGELELEHAVASSSDAGEVALEQAYAERQLTPHWAARAGLFLIPAGLLNENHEPTAYYGVERNFVETAIIPSTWREGGLQLVGNFDNGLTVQGGLSTGFNLNKWDATSSEGAESPLRAIHQELALAKARDLSLFGALNWRGVPGLQLGASVFSGGATHGLQPATSRITLWDLHARWTPGRWDLAALVAQGRISNTAAFNRARVGNPTLVPSAFGGAYVQAAYRLWTQGDYVLSPFVRAERFNTAQRFADLGAGLTPEAATSERVWTLGANLQVAQGLVLKADLQRFHLQRDSDRVNLGLGWSF